MSSLDLDPNRDVLPLAAEVSKPTTLASHGVRVDAMCPASLHTPLMEEWPATQYDSLTAMHNLDGQHRLRHMATTEEIGKVCASLLSAAAPFTTGQDICPDGGAALGYRR